MKILTALLMMLILGGIASAQDKVRVVEVRHNGNTTTVVAKSATIRYQLRCKAEPGNAFKDAQFCQTVEAGKEYEVGHTNNFGMDCLIFKSGVNPQTGLPTFYAGQHYEVVSQKAIRP
jgi:hypothetical protein